MANCNTCHKPTVKCSCKTQPDGCKPQCCPDGTFNTDCIEYNQSPNKSRLMCFLGINNKTTLTKILEKLDDKLCISPSECAKLTFGLGCDVGIDIVIHKVLDYLCTLSDVKVKVSAGDKKAGYLIDKVKEGDCIVKTIKQDNQGNQTLSLDLDFPCIEARLSCCGGQNVAIAISGVTSICGNNHTTLTCSTNCIGTITWSNGLTGPSIQASAGSYYATCSGVQSNVLVVTNTGVCNCVDSIWNYDGDSRCEFGVSELSQTSNCGTQRWIPGGNACQTNPCVSVRFTNVTINPVTLTYNCSGFHQVVVPGLGCIVVTTENGNWSYPPNTLVPALNATCNQVSYTTTRTQSFTRNNCPVGCTGSVVAYSQVYTSLVSQLDADNLAANDANFPITGQAYANTNGVCSGGSCSGGEFCNTVQVATGNFTRTNCSSGCTGQTINASLIPTDDKTIAAGEYCSSTLNAANALALAAAQALAQSYVNTNGTCTGCPGNTPTASTITVTQQPSCENGGQTLVNVSGITNGSRYIICTEPTFTCPNTCLSPSNTFSGSSFTLIQGVNANSGPLVYTVRIYNGTNCSLYVDKNFTVNNWACCCPTDADLINSPINCDTSTYTVTPYVLETSGETCDDNLEYGWSVTNNPASVTNWQSGATFTVLSNNQERFFFIRKEECTVVLAGASSRNCECAEITGVTINP